ncbi:MAG: hypothetical protein QOF62_3604 [Pyrinomonadaceae bacterium]|nr:hypothetical protein [Pyrinomonadaceae bacterium]
MAICRNELLLTIQKRVAVFARIQLCGFSLWHIVMFPHVILVMRGVAKLETINSHRVSKT